jgi:hypothetical protein
MDAKDVCQEAIAAPSHKEDLQVKKKLEIKKITLRNLDSEELTHIAGGTSTPNCSTTPDSGCGQTLATHSCVDGCTVTTITG